jgi:hypothetical protein
LNFEAAIKKVANQIKALIQRYSSSHFCIVITHVPVKWALLELAPEAEFTNKSRRPENL